MSLKFSSGIYSKDITHQLTRLANSPNYVSKTTFARRFEDDLKSILSCYFDKDSRIYIFIDDLDRADIQRATELMKAINLLLGLEESNLFFVIGLDREMVAAGIAAQHQSIMPYIAASRSASPEDQDLARIGLEYGYSFLEKSIQIPFRVPGVDDRRVSKLVHSLLAAGNESTDKSFIGQISDNFIGKDPNALAQS